MLILWSRYKDAQKIKAPLFSSVKLPNYEPAEIKKVSTELQMALAGASGVGVGTLAGLAAFGVESIIAAPAMMGASLVLCIKGFGLKRKAIENKKQAKQIEKSVDEIIAFYSELQETAESYRRSMIVVYNKYADGLQRINRTLENNNVWKQFSHEEKKNVENTVMLARLLYEMTQTEIVVRQGNNDKIETVNTEKIVKLQKQAAKLLEEAA